MEIKQALCWAAIAAYFVLIAFIERNQRWMWYSHNAVLGENPRAIHRGKRHIALGPSLVLLRPATPPQCDPRMLLRSVMPDSAGPVETLVRPV